MYIGMCMGKRGENYMSKLSENVYVSINKQGYEEKGKWSNKGKMSIRRDSIKILKYEINLNYCQAF
jgi:hypothetical protein